MKYTDSVTIWDFSQYPPDLAVVALGTNDFSETSGKKRRPELDGEAFVNDYNNFITKLRQTYPDAKFFVTNSPLLNPEKKQTLSISLPQVIDKQKAAENSSITQFAYEKRFT